MEPEDCTASLPTFQIERPSQEDLYTGGGHEHAATAIFAAIKKTPDMPLLGLEGDLGAGKSTVISILEKKLDDTYLFETFDVDTHSHSSVKATLIKAIHRRLVKLNAKNTDILKALNTAKDKALGNTLIYTRETDSQLTGLIVLFVISIMLSVRYGVNGLTNFFVTLPTIYSALFVSGWSNFNFSLESTVVTLAGFSPAFVLIYKKFWHDKKLKSQEKPIVTIANLFKRNSKDKISETLNVTREVGSLELEEALSAFIDAIPADKTLILVIDNIDRVEARLVREIWSDLNILSSLCSSRLRVIIPFSETHIAKALSDEGDAGLLSGREYISKRLPLIFRAPPVITAGWRKQFFDYWDGSIGFIAGKEAVADLVDIWRDKNQAITPRFLKRVVNDVASSYISCPEKELSGLCCAVYHLVYKRHRPNILIEDILSESDKTNKSTYIDSLLLTKRLLNKELQDSSVWASQIASIHYQTTSEIAKSELLVEPISTAFKNRDADEILRLSRIIGFDLYFKREIFSDSPESAFDLAYEISCSQEKEFAKLWLDEWLPKINLWAEECLDPINPNEVEGLKSLQDAGYEVDLKRIDSEFCRLDGQKSGEISRDDLFWLYDCSGMLGRIPKRLEQPSGYEFYTLLWPNRKKLPKWNVEEIDTPILLRKEILKELPILESSEEPILDDVDDVDLMRKLNISHKIGDKLFIEGETPGPFSVQNVGELLSDAIEYLPYTDLWGVAGQTPVLISEFKSQEGGLSDSTRLRCVSALFAHGLKAGNLFDPVNVIDKSNNTTVSESLWGAIQPYMSENDTSLKKDIIDFLSFVPFGSAVENLRTEDVSDYIGDALKAMIASSRILAINIDSIFEDYYSDLVAIFSEDEQGRVLEWLSAWHMRLKIDVNDWQEELLEDVFKYAVDAFSELAVESVDNPDRDKDDWKRFLCEPTKNDKAIVRELTKTGYAFKHGDQLTSVFLELVEGSDDRQWYEGEGWVAGVFNLLPDDDKARVLGKCKTIFGRSTLNKGQRALIVRCFKENFSLPKTMEESVRHAYIELFEEEDLWSWLDQQNWYFNSWDNDELKAIKSAIKNSDYEFGRISEQLSDANSLIKKIFPNKELDEVEDSEEG